MQSEIAELKNRDRDKNYEITKLKEKLEEQQNEVKSLKFKAVNQTRGTTKTRVTRGQSLMDTDDVSQAQVDTCLQRLESLG